MSGPYSADRYLDREAWAPDPDDQREVARERALGLDDWPVDVDDGSYYTQAELDELDQQAAQDALRDAGYYDDEYERTS